MECPVWEDRQVKFDIINLQNRLRSGEKSLAVIDYIEDTKGNPGDSGRLMATNLRLIWYSLVNKKFNLSVGYSRIITMSTKAAFSKIRGTTQALYILAAGINMRFEFLFTDLSSIQNQDSIFAPIFDIYKIYQRTFLYRELKLRGAIIQSGQLIVLPQEKVYRTLNGVWNLSSDQGNLGSFVVTSIRLVWFADVNETFNISLPYMQISYIKVRESKYGPALVIQTLETAGEYILGFRIDPVERLNEVYKELKSLYSVYGETPNFGVNYISKNDNDKVNDEPIRVEDIQEIDEKQEQEVNSKLNTYLAEGTTVTGPRQPFYCKELGFAMEKLRDGYKLSDLWEIIPESK